MRVLFVMPEARRLGGAEQMLWTILRHAHETRLRPSVVFLNAGPLVREVAELGLATTTLSAGRLRHGRQFVRTVRALARVYESERPDLVVSWLQKPHLYAGLASLATGISHRTVWWQHDIPDGRWLDRLATLIPAVAVGASSRAAAHAQARMRPHRRTFVIHPGIDPHRRADPAEVSALRTRLGIPSGRFVAGVVARLQPWKGQHHLLRAVAQLRQRGHDVGALVVGGDAYGLAPEYGPQLRVLAAELGLGDAALFTDHVSDTAPYMQLMDAIVSTSDAEPFGIGLLEAMSLGLPIVAVDAGGPAEFLCAEQTALLVRQADPRAFSGALERLITDGDLRTRLASAARTRFLEHHQAPRMVSELESRLVELSENQRPTQ